MKTTKQERINKAIKDYARILGVWHNEELRDFVNSKNTFADNPKLSVAERKLIGDLVEEFGNKPAPIQKPQLFISRRKDFRMFEFFNSAKSADGFDEASQTSLDTLDTDADLDRAVRRAEANGYTEGNGFFIVAVYSDGRQDQRYTYLSTADKLSAPETVAALAEMYSNFEGDNLFWLVCADASRNMRTQRFRLEADKVHVGCFDADGYEVGEVEFSCFNEVEKYVANAVAALGYRPYDSRTMLSASRAEVVGALGEARVRRLECEINQFMPYGEDGQLQDTGALNFVGAASQIAVVAAEYREAGFSSFSVKTL